ncbi:MAG: GAF domain-containing protein [Candidatus Rokubacteria bacterium]|nr:GAF domain-containing protein [Candidatus Rokubacteria bacterium]
MRRRGRLFRKYVVVFAGLVSAALLASGLLEIYFSYQEHRVALAAIQREKALAAAARIAAFVKEIERQVRWTADVRLGTSGAALQQRLLDYGRLQKHVPAITEMTYLDAEGREQVRASRLAINVVGSGLDQSREPPFLEAKGDGVWHGPVYFRKESEPYMAIAVGGGRAGGVTVAEVNLKFIWDVVSRITIGRAGLAYVVDRQGALVAHPDISLVLRKTSLASLEQVRVALAALRDPGRPADAVTIARDRAGRRVLTDYATISELGWAVFVEQPLQEAFEPLYASMQRTGLLVFAGVVLSIGAGLLLARRMVTPIQALREGAARIGAGELDQRLEVRTGDELEALAEQFNRMAAQLQESYAGLERKVEDRTRALTEALEQQTATAEILRVISGSPTDLRPVFDAILESATRLCDAHLGLLGLMEPGGFRMVADRGANPQFQEWLYGPPRAWPGSVTIVTGGGSLQADPSTGIGRMILERRPVHIVDLAEEPAYREGHPARVATVELGGARTFLAVPMLREEQLVGGLVIYRPEVRPFDDEQIGLLQTFASQAVIAIENVRLFKELEERTRELAHSVEELRALGEVGRAVSSTLDLETVLTTIVSRANQLSGTDAGAIYEYDEAQELFRLRATQNLPDEVAASLRAIPLRRGEGAVGRLAETREPVQIADITEAGVYRSRVREILTRTGYRALLAVPLLREDHIIGGLVVNRTAPGEFSPEVVELLRTFATQSALAIQNARLFEELGEKSRQLEVADRHKSEFLANMSHELRTPLNAIIGFSEVLVERMFGELNEKQDEYLRDIFGSGRHLLSLINDILDLSKIEAGRMELEVTRFDLPAAIDNALTLVRGRAANHGIALSAEVDPRLGEFSGDERKLKQVLLNLLSNAVKFTPEGGRVEVRAAPAAGGVEIAVRDTGIGIASEDQEAIFEEFRQVGSDYAKKREGTGLGLALTKRFVALHGGTIRVESEPGKGSTFTFTLPERPWPAS